MIQALKKCDTDTYKSSLPNWLYFFLVQRNVKLPNNCHFFTKKKIDPLQSNGGLPTRSIPASNPSRYSYRYYTCWRFYPSRSTALQAVSTPVSPDNLFSAQLAWVYSMINLGQWDCTKSISFDGFWRAISRGCNPCWISVLDRYLLGNLLLL